MAGDALQRAVVSAARQLKKPRRKSPPATLQLMGTVARTGIPGFIIGITAENTPGDIRCSLLALKPNGFVSPVRAY